jgi:hypothetical protein
VRRFGRPKGQGKTTSLRILAEEMAPSEGAARCVGSVGYMHHAPVCVRGRGRSAGRQARRRTAALFRLRGRKPTMCCCSTSQPTISIRTPRRWWRGCWHAGNDAAFVVSHDRLLSLVWIASWSCTLTETVVYVLYREQVAFERAAVERRRARHGDWGLGGPALWNAFLRTLAHRGLRGGRLR